MRIIVRADASTTIGTGHISRCLTLAKSLRERGAEVVFVSRQVDGDWCEALQHQGFETSRLATDDGETWQQDADATRRAIVGTRSEPDWLIVDHYALDRRWESAMRPLVKRIMVVDDLANRAHDCDLLLDQNLVAQMHSRYKDKVPEASGLLLGPEFALLQPAYADFHDRTPFRAGPIRRILISFGGADVDNLTGRALTALLGLNRSAIEIDVVITEGSIHAERIRQQAAAHIGVRVRSGLETLAPLMVQADLAIGAAGATTWERLCLGLPTVVVTIADNQVAIAEELNRRQLIRWLGHHNTVTESTLAEAITELLDRGLDEAWSRHCWATVDGNGTRRVCAVITSGTSIPLRARNAVLEDEARLLEWANDESTRRQTFHPEQIAVATHRSWFRERLRDPDGCRLYIIETEDSVPIGQVRFQKHDHSWELHYALAKVFRGRGLGRPMLAAALSKLHAEIGAASIFARVKADNRPSRRVFETIGFDSDPYDAATEIAIYRTVLKDSQEQRPRIVSESSKAVCESAIE